MMNVRQLFQQHLAPTSPAPIGLHITRAEGAKLWDADGKAYIDLIGGISVANMGHRHPKVIAAIKEQADKYLHVMVYGEMVQSPQVAYAALLAKHLPSSLDCVYFTNSGAEAAEGAIKLARRLTRRPNIIAAYKSYHGATTGALALLGDEYWREAFRPLMPGVMHFDYNSEGLLNAINEDVACVVLETVQAEAGVVLPLAGWLAEVRKRCDEAGALLILDEIQCGFGRTGRLWGFEHFDVVSDILLLGKALGGGMPLGAFIASNRRMQAFTERPVLGHITTFGGHPVSCAAGMAAMEALLAERVVEAVAEKSQRFRKQLRHARIKEVRSIGLLIAVVLENPETVTSVLQYALSKGVFSDWFLFAPECIRIAPPLTIATEEIDAACSILVDALG